MKSSILIVEDDTTARILLEDVLTDAGYHVTAAPDGETAIALLRQQQYLVVLTDIRMRSVDGIQVLTAAKQHEHPPSVILLTGYGSLDTSIAALRAGADDYLLKPCEPTELLTCVAKAVQRRQEQQRQADAIQTIFNGLNQLRGGVQPLVSEAAPEPSISPEETNRYIHIGHLTIDCFRHTATFNGQPLHLTPIEYALLLCLAEAQGRVVGYSEIIRRTHGISVDDMEAQTLIKPHIRNLRRKINPEYLSNVRGTGYVLAAPQPVA